MTVAYPGKFRRSEDSAGIYGDFEADVEGRSDAPEVESGEEGRSSSARTTGSSHGSFGMMTAEGRRVGLAASAAVGTRGNRQGLPFFGGNGSGTTADGSSGDPVDSDEEGEDDAEDEMDALLGVIQSNNDLEALSGEGEGGGGGPEGGDRYARFDPNGVAVMTTARGNSLRAMLRPGGVQLRPGQEDRASGGGHQASLSQPLLLSGDHSLGGSAHGSDFWAGASDKQNSENNSLDGTGGVPAMPWKPVSGEVDGRSASSGWGSWKFGGKGGNGGTKSAPGAPVATPSNGKGSVQKLWVMESGDLTARLRFGQQQELDDSDEDEGGGRSETQGSGGGETPPGDCAVMSSGEVTPL